MTNTAILLVEDDVKDQKFILKALNKADEELDIEVVKDAECALNALKNGTLPKIIITDLNMPGMGGRGLLDILKSDDRYKSIPTIVLSTSENESDIDDSYSRHANAYMVKPDSIAGYQRVASLLQDFWLKEVKLPRLVAE